MTPSLASLRRGVLRPRDAAGIYTQPALQFYRLELKGVLLKIAHGYYAHIPEASRGESWRPEIEAIALGIAQADYGKNGVALMHLSAARIHGAIPRAIAVAVVAAPKQRPVLKTQFGSIQFVKRDVESLRRVRTETELGNGWVTSIEQTTLDIARRSNLVTGMEELVNEALINLLPQCNINKLEVIAKNHNMKSIFNQLLNRTSRA